MGGYGALKFGVKHPEMFSFVGSMSGTFGAALWDESELKRFEPIWQTLLPVFGAPDNPTRPANDVYKLYGELSPAQIARLPYVYLDCGTGDPLLSASRKMNDLLTTRKIPHEYREAPGAHSWAYWDSQVQEVLRMAAKNLRSAEIDATQVH
jgi:S-formylglutathione hydrolase FrmB